MFNFASLFNQFRSQSNNGLNDLLEQPGTQVGRLLDEESFVSEFKSGNPRVMEYMKYDKFKELVEFVTVVGPAQDKKRGYKYPYNACQILSLDNNSIIQYFFPENTLTVEEKIVEQVEVEEEVEVDEETEVTQPSTTPVETQTNEQTPESTLTPEEKTKDEKEEKNAETPNESKEAEQPKETEEKNTDKEEEEKQTEKKDGQYKEETKQQISYPSLEQASKQPKTITRKVKKHTERTISHQVQPLIGALMSYFDGEVNYTLAGYVCKILTTFFTKKPADFLRYILEENITEKLLNHCQSRSVGQLIIKILTHETTICLQKRGVFFKSILNKLSNFSQIFVMSNLSSYVCEVIEKVATNLKGNNRIPQLNDTFFSLDVITQVIKNVMSAEENVSIYNAPILFTYLTNVPFLLPEDPQIVEEFKKLLEVFVDKSCEKLQVTSRERPKLGTGRVKIVEIIRFILKENILNSREIVANKQNFFPLLINLIKEYQWNNLLHNEVMKIIDVALLQQENSALNNAILSNNVLSNFINEETEEDKKIKAGDSVYRHRKGYIAHITNLAVKLREIANNNTQVKSLVQYYHNTATPFNEIYQSFVEKEVFNSRKSLAGYSMRKDLKHEIMFQKEDIIATYANFLQKCPSPVFEQEPQHVNIEHPDLIEELQKQLNDMSVKPKDEEEQIMEIKDKIVGEPEEQKLLEVPEAQVVDPQYWVVHLDYNVDDLMEDL